MVAAANAENMKMFKMNFLIANLPVVAAGNRAVGVATAMPDKIPVWVAIPRVVALVNRESGKLLAMQKFQATAKRLAGSVPAHATM